jgi:hypothetical protein
MSTGLGIHSGITEQDPIKKEKNVITNPALNKLSNTLEKIHIEEFNKNKKKKYITF